MRLFPIRLRVPPAWCDLLREFDDCGFDDAVLAGGALRDLDHGVAPKDLDIFVWNRKNTLARLRKFLGAPKVIAHPKWCSMSSTIEQEVYGVYEFPHTDSPVPVQVILLAKRCTFSRVLCRFDFGLSQIGCGVDGRVFATEAYMIDRALERMSVVRCDCRSQLIRSFKRFSRIRPRYPNHHMDVPSWAYAARDDTFDHQRGGVAAGSWGSKYEW